jgi:hypothetical protein
MAKTLLYAHLISLLLIFMNAGAVHLAEVRAVRAETVGEARTMLRTGVALGPFFGVGSLLLVVTGLALVRELDDEFSYGESWIVAAVIALVVINAVGAGWLGPRLKRHADALTGEGPLTSAQREGLRDKAASMAGWFNTGTAMGIVFLMVDKPEPVGCVLALVIAAAAGVAVGLLQHSLLAKASPTPA